MIPRLPLLLLMLAAAGGYDAALWLGNAGSVWLVTGYAVALCAMVRAKTARRAFYAGIGAALLIDVPHLWFLQDIFQVVALPLWLSQAVWSGVFCGTLHVMNRKWGTGLVLALAPVLWLGLEYYRSEVWALRFAWMTPGFALPAGSMGWLFQSVGVYGSGAILLFAGCAAVLLKKPAWAVAAGLILPALFLVGNRTLTPAGVIRVTGVQYEQSLEDPVFESLETARLTYPDTSLFVLPEYSFQGRIPGRFTKWCQEHQTWLVAGGKDFLPRGQGWPKYYNTAFVIGPDGGVAHRQAKSMPIQFFADGEPAATQAVWESPWGKLGICICYDQNYAGVVDPLARQQMQALIIPTMDLQSWGPHQHWLSARLATTRAVEYGVPVVRLASSGYSQMLDARGQLLAAGTMPGQGEIVTALLPLSAAAHQPWDRLPARLAMVPAGLLVLWAIGISFLDGRRRRAQARKPAPA